MVTSRGQSGGELRSLNGGQSESENVGIEILLGDGGTKHPGEHGNEIIECLNAGGGGLAPTLEQYGQLAAQIGIHSR